MYKCLYSGGLTDDYMHVLIECNLERFASINDPENWTTNAA